MALRSAHPKFRLSVVDRAGLAGEFEAIARREGRAVEVVACTSALEVMSAGGAGTVGGLVLSVGACGPFLMDLLRWTESAPERRVPTIVVGAGNEEDEAASRIISSRKHVQWAGASPSREDLAAWLLLAIEVHSVRAYRLDHDTVATGLREARIQLFHGFIKAHTPAEGAPCGPPLPTTLEEIQPLRDARAQFERSHIQSAVRECGSLKDAALALGISYTSLWRRLRQPTDARPDDDGALVSAEG
ncbi:MAG: hypothetical protein H6729_00690 [Deltaproteobacteria bacterium]|nr:hypothetical protein [Deltaproteobacteria bacterium]